LKRLITFNPPRAFAAAVDRSAMHNARGRTPGPVHLRARCL